MALLFILPSLAVGADTAASIASSMRTFSTLLTQVEEARRGQPELAKANDPAQTGIWKAPKTINFSVNNLVDEFALEICTRVVETQVPEESPDLNGDGIQDKIILFYCEGQPEIEGAFLDNGEPIRFQRGDTILKFLCGGASGLEDCTYDLAGQDYVQIAGERPGWAFNVTISDLNDDGLPDLIFPQQNDTSALPEIPLEAVDIVLEFCNSYWDTEWFSNSEIGSEQRYTNCFYAASDTYLLSSPQGYNLKQFPEEIPLWSQGFSIQERTDGIYAFNNSQEGSFTYKFVNDEFILVSENDSSTIKPSYFSLKGFYILEKFEWSGISYALGFPSIADPAEYPECAPEELVLEIARLNAIPDNCISDGFTVLQYDGDELIHAANWDAKLEPGFQWGEYEMLVWPTGEKVEVGGYCNYRRPCSAIKYQGLWHYGDEASPYLFGFGYVVPSNSLQRKMTITVQAKTSGPWGEYLETTELQPFMYKGCGVIIDNENGDRIVVDECTLEGKDLREKNLLLKFSFDPSTNTLAFDGNLTDARFLPHIDGVLASADFNLDGHFDFLVRRGSTAQLHVSDDRGILRRVAVYGALPYGEFDIYAKQLVDFNGDGFLDYLRVRDISGDTVLEVFEARLNPAWAIPATPFDELLPEYTACAEARGPCDF